MLKNNAVHLHAISMITTDRSFLPKKNGKTVYSKLII